MNFDMPTEKKPDLERENILKKVKDYFSEAMEANENSPSQKEMTRLAAVIDDMHRDDYNSAYEYLEEEIERLNGRITEVGKTEVGRMETIPKCETAIRKLEELRDSLHLSEK